jgi:hypothetical protein
VTERSFRLRNAGQVAVRLMTAVGGAGSTRFLNREAAFKLNVYTVTFFIEN